MSKLITINCRDAADSQQQHHWQRVNATAHALHADLHPHQPSAQQPAPYATPRPRAEGTDSLRLQRLQQRLTVLHLERLKYRRSGNRVRVDELSRRITITQAMIENLEGEPLPSRGHPCSAPNLYEITVPTTTHLIRGEEYAVFTPERRTLNTHDLPESLRERLNAYLLSGADMLPYWYCKTRRRLYRTSRVNDDALSLLSTLASYAQPENPAPVIESA